jgi:hypothetical protein
MYGTIEWRLRCSTTGDEDAQNEDEYRREEYRL